MNWRVFILVSMAAAPRVGAATLSESFAGNPLDRGWRAVGDASLFLWNATNENLEVTWDSERTNSYFHLPLGTILSTNDDFSLAFDLRLSDIAIGTSTDKPHTFPIAVGFLNVSDATATNFFRGAGHSAIGPKNLVEFSYFPDSGFGATFAPTVVSTNNRIAFSDNHPLEMTVGDLFRIAMTYTASNRVLKTSVTRNGAPYGSAPGNTLHDLNLASHPDFRVDALAVVSYSDAIQIGLTEYWGSIRAHGTVDNFVVTVPDPPVMNFVGTTSNSVWRAEFTGRPGWLYTLRRTTDFQAWTSVAGPEEGRGASLFLVDTNPPAEAAFYRVQAQKP